MASSSECQTTALEARMCGYGTGRTGCGVTAAEGAWRQ